MEEDTCVTSTVSDEETILIEKINSERVKILQLLNNTQIRESYGVAGMPVFEKYAAANRAFLDALKQPENVESFLGEPAPPLLETLRKEIDALDEDLATVIEKANAKKEESERLEKRVRNLNAVMEKKQSLEEPVNGKNIGIIEDNLMKRFQKEKQQLKVILATILPDDEDTRNVIAKLVESGIKNRDAYLTLEGGDGVAERVAMLVRTNLFEVHPLDPLKLRMVDLD